ncbi:MAG TPA: hypothetical protein VIJ12_00320 [Candidatus Baltobacteraceae bacterium]
MMLATAVATAAPSQAARPFDPYQIIARARAFWELQRYPSSVDYTIRVAASVRGTPDRRTYRARWYARSNEVAIDPVSAQERADPYRPGSGFGFGFIIGAIDVGGKGTGVHGDLLGVPILAPNYAFAIARYTAPQERSSAELVAEIRAAFHDPAPEKVAQLQAKQGLAVIATVSSIERRDYDVTLAGVETYGDHRDFHLMLRPTHDPGRLRLRQLWIDVRTFATDRLIDQGNFVDGPSPGASWSVTFDDIGGARYIATEAALTPLRDGSSFSHTDYDDVTVSFEDIVPASGRRDAGSTKSATLTEPAQP